MREWFEKYDKYIATLKPLAEKKPMTNGELFSVEGLIVGGCCLLFWYACYKMTNYYYNLKLEESKIIAQEYYKKIVVSDDSAIIQEYYERINNLLDVMPFYDIIYLQIEELTKLLDQQRSELLQEQINSISSLIEALKVLL